MELGITGHLTRGNEVIEILEMLGGKNCCRLNGDKHRYFYYIGEKYKDISYCYIGPDEIKGYEILSLDDFLEKFPYKVGDKVKVWVNHEHFSGPRTELEEAEITSMRWNAGRCEVAYRLKDITGEFYKEEIKCKVDDNCFKYNNMNTCNDNTAHEEHKKIAYISTNNEDYADQIEIELGDDYEYKFEMNRLYLVKKKSKYPKTYEECCDILKIPNDERYIDIDVPLDYNKLLSAFTKLLICRDAYWKIIGEEMGLDKPWSPDFAHFNGGQCYYFITTRYGAIAKTTEYTNDEILVFPYSHKEIAIEFYNNFKLLIENCKELL